ncbi:NAD+ synthase [Halobaculum sp. P14]|uniref:NAD+ synthase n=1 Tax=Halobaculum sp. P14 TaxID=3421638 RepID=UPI003EBF2E48
MTRIDPADAAPRVEAFLEARLGDAGADGYVVGVSGGLDSAVALHLAVEAVGADRVVGATLPGEPSDPENTRDARDLCADYGVDHVDAHIADSVESVTAALPGDLDTLTVGNVRARIRMVLEYAVANERDLLVCGPDNRSEWLLGYFTKYGDGGVDVRPLGDLYKTEVFDLARHLGLDRFAEKTPSAELWEGQTDADELGATYDVIDPVLRALVDDGCTPAAAADRCDADRDTVERLAELHRSSEHKRGVPPTPGLREDG